MYGGGILGVVALALALAGEVSAKAVLMLSSGDATLDQQTQAVLQLHGHVVTIGPQYFNFTGAGLVGQDVVLLLANLNKDGGDMPLAGQTALVNFVSAGKGLVTSEFTVWKRGQNNNFAALSTIFPVVPSSTLSGGINITYTQDTPDPILNSGLPATFSFSADHIIFVGTETKFAPQPGASVFYKSAGATGGEGLIGWRAGAGRVLQFSTILGTNELTNPNYGRLVANAVSWAGQGPGCDLQLNKASFVNGDQMIASVVRLTNASAASLPIELGIWFAIPTLAPISFASVGADGKVSLPAGFNQNVGPLPLFTVTSAFPRGTYGFHCRLLDPVTKQPLTADFNTFQVQ